MAETKRRDRTSEPNFPPKSSIREWFEALVQTFIMAGFAMTFVVRAVNVPTGSMQNTILIGDHLLTNKFIFASGSTLPFLPQREVRRGDIVVFKYPGNPYGDPLDGRHPGYMPFETLYVKRVIGMPGDRIEVRGDKVLINDQPLPEQIVVSEQLKRDASLEEYSTLPPRGDEKYRVYYRRETVEAAAGQDETMPISGFNVAVDGKPATVPPNSYFMMGDGRDYSKDSRAFGFVHRDLIIGRALFNFWSYDESKPKSNFLTDFFTNTRWKRTGTMIK